MLGTLLHLIILTLTPHQLIHKPLNHNSLDDVFMPKDDAINSSVGEIEEIDRELEEFKRFCLLT